MIHEELSCHREPSNMEDPFAVAVINNDMIVGHVPRKISAMCSMFLRKGGVILCTVTGTRRYSSDLAQGGMEVPCKISILLSLGKTVMFRM